MFHVKQFAFVEELATITTMIEQRVCDYEGSDYRTRFWEKGGRAYEDQVERIALRRLMPAQGDRLIDIGAGFGRLADEYSGYQQVVLLDYSASLLREAKERLGHDPRFLYVAANWYQMPFVNGTFNTMVQVRTIHHAADASTLISELARISRPQGSYILEFASKLNLKAMLRYALKRQSWSPYTPEPVEFVEMNFNFHPKWIRNALVVAGFRPQQTLSVSHFRFPLIKKIVPTPWLVNVDSLAQKTGNWWQLTPSVFIQSRTPEKGVFARSDQLFACPTCQQPLKQEGDRLPSELCQVVWHVEDGVYNFKESEPL